MNFFPLSENIYALTIALKRNVKIYTTTFFFTRVIHSLSRPVSSKSKEAAASAGKSNRDGFTTAK